MLCGSSVAICVDPCARTLVDKSSISMQRPAGVTAISFSSCLAAIYLWTIGVVKLLAPEAISLMSGAHADVRTGTRRTVHGDARRHWLCADWLGIISPAQLGALGRDARDGGWSRVAGARRFPWRNSAFPLFWYGLQIALRAAVAWYLAQAPAVVDAFAGKTPALYGILHGFTRINFGIAQVQSVTIRAIRGSLMFFVQLTNPDVAVAHGIAVILQLQRSLSVRACMADARRAPLVR